MSASYDRAQIVRLYTDGATVAQIVAEIGLHRSAVYRHLDAAGVQRRDDRATAPRPKRSVCMAGVHPMAGENVRIDKNGARHCRTCEQIRWLIRAASSAGRAGDF